MKFIYLITELLWSTFITITKYDMWLFILYEFLFFSKSIFWTFSFYARFDFSHVFLIFILLSLDFDLIKRINDFRPM